MKKTYSTKSFTLGHNDFSIEIPLSTILDAFQVLLITSMVCYNLGKSSR